MQADELDRIVGTVLSSSAMRTSRGHGETHWLRVASIAIELASREPGSDPLVGFLFGLFHDSRRENEYDDPEHGPRAARFVEETFMDRSLLTDPQLRALSEACRDHTEGRTTDDPVIGVCWDADRLDLWRVGTTPDARFLSTGAGRSHPRTRSETAFGALDWGTLARSLGEISEAPSGTKGSN